MNILLVTGPGISLKEPYNSGIEAFVVSLANELIDQGHTVDVVAREAERNSKFTLLHPFTGSTSDKPNFFKRLKEKNQYQKLDIRAYDTIHYNMFYPHLLKAGLCFKKTSFLTLHSPADKRRVRVYRELALRTDISFIAISERVKSQWDRALESDIPLIHNGIDMSLWSSSGARSCEYLLWSGRINEEKNVEAAICVAKDMQMPLKIAGRVTDQSYFEKKVKPHLNYQIEYVGHITQGELSNLAKKAFAYLATATWQEPFGLAALEMLASGVPVVGFDTAVPLNWKHRSVLTTPSMRWQDLVEMVRNSRAISSLACKEFASSMNIELMTSNYVKLYEDVLMRKGLEKNLQSVKRTISQVATKQP